MFLSEHFAEDRMTLVAKLWCVNFAQRSLEHPVKHFSAPAFCAPASTFIFLPALVPRPDSVHSDFGALQIIYLLTYLQHTTLRKD